MSLSANNKNMASEGKMDIAQLLDASDLTYLAERETNVVIERSQKKQFSHQVDYQAGQTMVAILNSGNDLISFKDSTMRFRLAVFDTLGNESKTAEWGGGSILNLLENIRLITRSGEVLTEINKLNLFNYFYQKLTHTYEWRTQQQGKELMGFQVNGAGDKIKTGTEYVIPMRALCPLFDDDVLSPANICRGLRIEITLAAVNVAFKDANVVAAERIGAYTVSDVELLLDSYRLNGGAMNALNTMAAKDGLVLTYGDVNNSRASKAAGATSISSEVRQSVTMANAVWSAIRLTDNVAELKVDSFATREVGDTDNFQYRIGSVYLPQERIVGPKQWYAQLGYATGKTCKGTELGIRAEENERKQNSVAAATLDRYYTSGSGMAINASTVLNFTAQVDAAAADLDIFLLHTRRAVCFLESCRVYE